jgi:hypothetical protein
VEQMIEFFVIIYLKTRNRNAAFNNCLEIFKILEKQNNEITGYLDSILQAAIQGIQCIRCRKLCI